MDKTESSEHGAWLFAFWKRHALGTIYSPVDGIGRCQIVCVFRTRAQFAHSVEGIDLYHGTSVVWRKFLGQSSFVALDRLLC